MEERKLLWEKLAPHWWDMSPWEVKTFMSIYWFADPKTGELVISLYGLSQKVNSRANDLLPWLEKLKARGLVGLAPGPNPLLESRFKLWPGKSKFPSQTNHPDVAEIEGLPVDPQEEFSPVNGTVNVIDNDRSLRKTVPDVNERSSDSGIQQNGVGGETTQPLSATSIAESLDDLDNLALYEAYLKRYSDAIIRKAYRDVLQTPPEKIKKSAGAYFTFLVKKYGEEV